MRRGAPVFERLHVRKPPAGRNDNELPMGEMQEAAQLARNYMKAIDAKDNGLDRAISTSCVLQDTVFPYKSFMQLPRTTCFPDARHSPEDLDFPDPPLRHLDCPSFGKRSALTVTQQRDFSADDNDRDFQVKRQRKSFRSSEVDNLERHATVDGYFDEPGCEQPPPLQWNSILMGNDARIPCVEQYSPSSVFSEPDNLSPTPRKSFRAPKLLHGEPNPLDSPAFRSSNHRNAADFCLATEPDFLQTSSHPNGRALRQQMASEETDFSQDLQFGYGNVAPPPFDKPQFRYFENGDEQYTRSYGPFFSHPDYGMQPSISQQMKPELGVYANYLSPSHALPIPTPHSLPESYRMSPHHLSHRIKTGTPLENLNHIPELGDLVPNSYTDNPMAGLLPVPRSPELSTSDFSRRASLQEKASTGRFENRHRTMPRMLEAQIAGNNRRSYHHVLEPYQHLRHG